MQIVPSENVNFIKNYEPLDEVEAGSHTCLGDRMFKTVNKELYAKCGQLKNKRHEKERFCTRPS